MKKIIIILLTLLLNLSPVYAAKWYKVTDKSYVDLNSLQMYNELPYLYNSTAYIFWVKTLNDKSNHFINLEKIYNKKIWYSLNRVIIDCSSTRLTVKSVFYYDLQNQLINSQEESSYQLVWVSIPPDSIASWYYDWVCKSR